ncbi:polymerase (DNA-directed), delta 4, isoform CRA_e [Rattus norvegicus]|uniref:Polymerase (DNA-directed), delta 4, isoform CRA_e n=1 Tax=Rattus norvegicus TaxID=10116 RepID=A6HYW4_RAT|nr:polymerase (DNA-directed), delta 4, isoform CRA_e [Rattus norvegicus]EDM12396.1 polymerase (DNA-directed), delta 4, isoform CRA_e [Rattus norvegicus]
MSATPSLTYGVANPAQSGIKPDVVRAHLGHLAENTTG